MRITREASPSNPLHPDGSNQIVGYVEVLVFGALYIVLAHAFLKFSDFSSAFPATFSENEKSVGAGFLAGAIVQFVLVFTLALYSRDMRLALSQTVRLGTLTAWTVALLACFIHIATLTLAFIDRPERILEISTVNFTLSVIPAFDGWSQEVMFRGYVIFRLARAGAPAAMQIAISAILFSAIHVGYVGANLLDVLMPLIGTAILGGFLAWSVRLGNGALMPAIVSHVLLVFFSQPWLAFS